MTTYVIASCNLLDNTNDIFFYEHAASTVDALLQFAQDEGVLESMPDVHDMDEDEAVDHILTAWFDMDYSVNIAEF